MDGIPNWRGRTTHGTNVVVALNGTISDRPEKQEDLESICLEADDEAASMYSGEPLNKVT
jgi:hypothetical protein